MDEEDGDNKKMKPEMEINILSSTCLPVNRGPLVSSPETERKRKRSDWKSDSAAENGNDVKHNRSGDFLKMNKENNMEMERGSIRNSLEQIKKDDGDDDEGFDLESASLIVEEEKEKNKNKNMRKRRREMPPSGMSKVEEEGVENPVESTGVAGGVTGRRRTTTTGKKVTRILNISTTRMPSEADIEGFFAKAEMEQSKKFMDRYNFDVVNDVPMEGRYQWVKLF